jgi:hypothetical protein
VEIPPPFLPSRLDRLDGDVGERGSHRGLAGGVGVDREFPVGLLEPLRVELEQLRPRFLQQLVRDGNGDPANPFVVQRKALLSFPKNPSSGR